MTPQMYLDVLILMILPMYGLELLILNLILSLRAFLDRRFHCEKAVNVSCSCHFVDRQMYKKFVRKKFRGGAVLRNCHSRHASNVISLEEGEAINDQF